MGTGMSEAKSLTALIVEPPGAHEFGSESMVAGYKVVFETYADPKQALMWLKDNTPDLMLVNLHGLKDAGLNLLKLVRGSKRLKHLPVSVMHKVTDNVYGGKLEAMGLRSTMDVGLPVSNILLQSIKDYLIENDKNQKKVKRTHDLLAELKEKLKNEELELPSQPKLLFSLINLLNDDNSTIQQISDLVEKEPAVCAKIIKAANSIHFAAAKPVISASDAVMRIGLKRTLNYVLVIEQGQMFETELEPFKKIRADIWHHSITTAITARYIGQCVHYDNVDSLFAFGLLHDLGKLALLRALHELPKAAAMEEDVIMPILSKMHTRLGGSLLSDWQFPQEFVDVAKYHHDEPVKDKHGKYLVLVGYANQIAHFTERKFNDSAVRRLMRLAHAKILQFNPDYYKKYPAHLEAELAMMQDLFN